MRRTAVAVGIALVTSLAPACDTEATIDDRPERNPRPGMKETPREEEN